MNRESATRQWYRDYYRRKGADRNDLRRNRGVLFQTLALDTSVVRAAYRIDHAPETASVLDVGCGNGGDADILLRLGYATANLTRIDIRADRIAEGRERYPRMTFVHGDASDMDLADGAVDLVYESTMFATLPDDAIAAAIAGEMLRVCKPGGCLLLVDWRTPRPGNPRYRALTRKRLSKLFHVGEKAALAATARGALVPPLGRFLSGHLPCLYFLTSAPAYAVWSSFRHC
jgi:ubiquinone/menaquinone biosynthesis C-methylase UbiE